MLVSRSRSLTFYHLRSDCDTGRRYLDADYRSSAATLVDPFVAAIPKNAVGKPLRRAIRGLRFETSGAEPA